VTSGLLGLEFVLKAVGLTPRGYFSSRWNVLDFSLVLLSCLQFFYRGMDGDYRWMRIVRLLRLLQVTFKEQSRNIQGTFRGDSGNI
jgi:hypothetical protein